METRYIWESAYRSIQRAYCAAPEVYRELLDGLNGGRLRVRVLIGNGAALSRRTAVQIVALLRGRAKPGGSGKPTTVIDADGVTRRFPTVTAAATALGVSHAALWWGKTGRTVVSQNDDTFGV